MTNKIIEAAREAGFRTGAITLTDTTIEPIPFIAPVSATDCKNELSRFYAIARAEALEDAAKVCETYAKHKLDEEMPIAYVYGARDCAAAIRKLGEQHE